MRRNLFQPAHDPRAYPPVLDNLQLNLDPFDRDAQIQRGHTVLTNSLTNFLKSADNAALNVGQHLTVSFWFRPDSTTATDRAIIGQMTNNTAWTDLAWVIANSGTGGQGDEIRMIVGTNGPAYAVTQTTAPLLVAGQWVHVACVWDGTLADASKITIYTNGVARATAIAGTWPSTLPNSAADLIVGLRGHNSWTANYAGGISDVALFAESLTATQVGYLYSAGYGNWYESATDSWDKHNAGLPAPIEFFSMEPAAGASSGSRPGEVGLLTLLENSAALSSVKHTIVAADKSRHALQFGAVSNALVTDRRLSAVDWIPDGINGRPCWECFNNIRFLCAHFDKDSWMAESTGDVLFVVRELIVPVSEAVLFMSCSHEDDSVDPDSDDDNHIGAVQNVGTGEMFWRYKGDGQVNDNGYSTILQVGTTGVDYVLNWRFDGADHYFRLNGQNFLTDRPDAGLNFFQNGTLRTNVALQIGRRLFTGVINNDSGGVSTNRYGQALCYGPCLTVAENRQAEAFLAARYGIALFGDA